ncbi:Abi family protein [Geobacillus thermoleovorans]|uniref:Abi family protein n=1 Tax=Geobacillus thermoleovorans TaxID=33941 RepID=UPI00345B9A3B
MKPFKTYRQQLRILRDRGLTISNGARAMRILEKANYYSLINGYKDLFLVKDHNGNAVTPEKYKNGVTFEEIYALYCFDRELRNTLLKELLKFESSIKSKLSYRFSEMHREPNAYLHMQNFSRDPKKLKNILKLITVISNEISKQSDRNNPISHYLDKHDGVPLWVLVKYLTLGNIQNFYICLDDSIQNKIAQDFANSYRRDYNSSIHFTSDMLVNILKTATLFRNVCAHEERLYNFRLEKPARSRKISVALGIPINLLDKGNFFTMLSFLKLVIPRSDHKSLIRNLKHLFGHYSNQFSSVTFDEILNEMGFDPNWETLF